MRYNQTWTLNNTTLFPYYFPHVSGKMDLGLPGSNNSAGSSLTFGTTVSFFPQSQGFTPFDCPGTWSLRRIKYSRVCVWFSGTDIICCIDLPGPHLRDVIFVTVLFFAFFLFFFFCFSFLSCLCEELVSHWSRQCLSCKPPSVVALPLDSTKISIPMVDLRMSRWAKSPKCISGPWFQQCHSQQKEEFWPVDPFPNTFLIEMVGNDEERKGTIYQNRSLSGFSHTVSSPLTSWPGTHPQHKPPTIFSRPGSKFFPNPFSSIPHRAASHECVHKKHGYQKI